ncbi:MAG: PQQ-dependent sugar dehydrogenase [Candidatus Limnocylindrales bacterium]
MSDRSRGAVPSTARRGFCGAALAVLLSACNSTATPTPPTAPGPTASPTASSSPNPAPSTGFDPAGLTIRLDPVVDGLNSPVAVVDAGDASGRLFVVEQPGVIRVVRDGVLEDLPFLDISRRIVSGGERGLLGLAFAPDFPADPRLYVDDTNLEGNSVIASFRIPAATPDQADPSSERILLQFDQPFPNHNGGGLAFGPDGDLYIAVGDGGSGGDPLGNGQKLDTVLGKLLRIRPGASDNSQPAYTIPPDAPFASEPSARPEIRAYGLRNPWRFSFDRATGDLWIGDVGQGAWEEVDVIRASDPPNVAPNFGWNIMEGDRCFNADTCNQSGLTLPVAEYSHDLGCAIIGGFVGRDPSEPALYGGYVYGDSCSGSIWVLDAARPESGAPRLVLDSGRTISSFGEDEAGRLYLTDLGDGTLYRVVPVP